MLFAYRNLSPALAGSKQLLNLAAAFNLVCALLVVLLAHLAPAWSACKSAMPVSCCMST